MASYKPVLPGRNDNVSHASPFKEFLLLLSAAAGVLLLIYWALGLMVDFSADHLSFEDEAALFESLSLDWGEQLSGDVSESSERMQSLLEGLRQCSMLPIPVVVSRLNNSAPNALAVPGGRILVFSGLFDYVQSENALAFVLAHELGHFIDRDHLKGLGRGLVLLSLSTLLTGPDSSLSALLTPAAALNNAHFSQQREAMADGKALEIMQCYYGHTTGATEFFRALKRSPYADAGTNHYFDSHPQLDARIEAIEAWRIAHDDVAGVISPW